MSINLKKGSSILLEKEKNKLEEICIGLDWGTIKSNGLWGLLKSEEAVDLDASVVTFNDRKERLETIYFNNLKSSDSSIIHSGDDRKGDSKSDGFDNEVITVDLRKVKGEVTSIVFFLNSFKEQDFATIPYSKIRIFEGTKHVVKEIFATFNLASDESYKKKISMVMGKLTRTNNSWSFHTIGEPLYTKGINETVEEIRSKFL